MFNQEAVSICSREKVCGKRL